MSLKLLLLILFVIQFGWSLFLLSLERRSVDHPIPDNVKDLYNVDEYERWKGYQSEKCRLRMISLCAGSAVSFILYLLDVYALIGNAVSGLYAGAAAVLAVSVMAGLLTSVPADHHDTLVIEQRYGLNRSSSKTFWADQLKQLLLSLFITVGICFLFILLHRSLGDAVLIVFAAVMFAIILFIAFLYPFLSRIFNKFTPLEDGELKGRLTALLEKNGCRVREIKVMDASRRSSKANAYFTGFGKTKTIVLYDTLLSIMTADEICAVFTHEMEHSLHKDTLKNQLLSLLNISVLAILAWLTARTGSLYTDCGFTDVNYGFALTVLTEVEMAFISPLLSLISSAHSRTAEYRADAGAVREGCGEALICALKKLTKENFGQLAPDPLLVKLSYSHPTLSQRIDAIENEMKKNGVNRQ